MYVVTKTCVMRAIYYNKYWALNLAGRVDKLSGLLHGTPRAEVTLNRRMPIGTCGGVGGGGKPFLPDFGGKCIF